MTERLKGLKPGDLIKAQCPLHGEWYHRVEEDGSLICVHTEHNGEKGTPGYLVDKVPSQSLRRLV
jgi:hypothetical protein